PPTKEEIQRAREWIRRETAAVSALRTRIAGAAFVGTAGTITSLAAMAQRLPAYEPSRIHNYRLTMDAIVDLEQQLLTRTKAERVGMPGLEKNREDVIAAGTIILRTVMETLGERVCIVSDLGLREGLLIHLAMRP
ncbi:MAG TPA: Ppx/GppA family phosphatase, partial [Nitrospira sp.]|nr:Ppx/GppA family phosphatase [Nitrospira sp.]